MCAEKRYAKLCPLVETLAKSNAKRVPYGKGSRDVGHLLAVSKVEVCVVILCRVVRQVFVLKVADVKGVDDACNGDELLWHLLLVLPRLQERIDSKLPC